MCMAVFCSRHGRLRSLSLPGAAMAAIWLATAKCHGGRITIRPSVGLRGPSIARDGDDETLPRTDLALEPKNWPDWLATRADAAGIPLSKATGANKDQARSPNSLLFLIPQLHEQVPCVVISTNSVCYYDCVCACLSSHFC